MPIGTPLAYSTPSPGPWVLPTFPDVWAIGTPAPSGAVVEVGTSSFVAANTATVTTASVTPGAGNLLVAYCAQGNGTGGAASLGTVTDSIGTTWTRLAGEGCALGVAEIWVADGSATARTVTYDPGGSGASGTQLIVRWYSGALTAAGQIANAASATNGGGPNFNLGINPKSIGSYVVGALARAADVVTVVAQSGTTILGQGNGSAGDTAALFRSTALTTGTDFRTYGFTNSPSANSYLALAEIAPVPIIPVVVPAPSMRSLGTVESATTLTPSFAAPPGAVSTDVVMILFFCDDGRSTVTSVPTGFTAIPGLPQNNAAAGSPSHVLMGYWGRFAAVGAGPYSFTVSAGSAPFVEGRSVAVQDCVTSGSPFDSTGAATSATSAVTTAPLVTATSTGANRYAFYAATNWNGGAWTPAATFTEQWDANDEIITFDDLTLPSPTTVTPQAVCAGSAQSNAWVGILLPTSAVGGVTPAAEQPSATAAAFDASVTVTVAAEQPSASATAFDATVSTVVAVSPAAETTSATASAADATASAAPNAEATAATASAADASAAVTASAETTSATAAAFDATVSTATATNANAEQAAATATAADASVAVTAAAEQPSASATAANPAAAVGVQAEQPGATAAAFDATVATGDLAPAETTSASAVAWDVSVATSSYAEATAATGAAFDASAATNTNPAAETTSATAAAFDATVSTSSNVTAPAEAGLATASAADASVAVTVGAEAATATSTGLDAVAATGVQAGTTTASAVGLDALVSVAPAAGAGAASATASDATLSVGVGAESASAGASAFDATVITNSSASANAEPTTASASAYDATVITGTAAPAGLASATASAADGRAAITANAGLATAAAVGWAAGFASDIIAFRVLDSAGAATYAADSAAGPTASNAEPGRTGTASTVEALDTVAAGPSGGLTTSTGSVE